MQTHSLSLAKLRDAVRLSSPVRHPDAKGGKPAQSQHVNGSPGLPLISISQFAAWVQKATDCVNVYQLVARGEYMGVVGICRAFGMSNYTTQKLCKVLPTCTVSQCGCKGQPAAAWPL
ncbi:hypothetical protein ABBQ32_007710 [Trebouxia sp. C0010 RCD-2024]